MKVLAFAHFPSPYRVEVFKGLSAQYDLTVFFQTMSDQNRNSAWFCKETGLHSYSLLEENGQREYKKALQQLKQYDLVLAYDYHTASAIKLELSCIAKHVPYIMNLDGAFIRKNPVKNLIKRFLVTHASAYFASGEHAKNYFKHFGAKEEKIAIHPFTSLHKNEIYKSIVTSEEKTALRKELEMPDLPTVITIGQFIPRKGFDILLEAWGDMDKKAQLFIIGGGDDEGLYEEIIKANNYENVHLIGYRPKNEVFKFYRAADIFVLPTREDIWGLVVNEAMACGIPVIASNMCLGGVELIHDGENGYIVRVEARKDLHDRIEELIDNKELCKEMGKNNLLKISDYTYENVVKSHIDTIESMIAGG